MDSSWMETNSLMRMDTSKDNRHFSTDDDYIPTWKMPISKSFSSALSSGERACSDSSSGIGSGGDRDPNANSDPESCPIESFKSHKASLGMEEEGQVIQILLPCIICSRTFAPEALERHSKVCTKVNVKTPQKPERGVFESAEQRKKGTKAEYFIPPPEDAVPDSRLSSFSRGSKNRSSLRGTSCTTRTTLNSDTLSQIGVVSPYRRQRSISISRGERGQSKPPSEYLYDDRSEFGSNSEESHIIDGHLPSYAKPIAPTDECPYCTRCFGPKAYDRHVEYCKKKYIECQYDKQPVPKEKIEAMERQGVRTSYRPMKGSSSCTSLRAMSPNKDFASVAYKLFGLRRSDGASNLYNNQLSSFKKSNESLTNSCYGDYTRGMMRPSPSSRPSMANKINNLFSKAFHYQPSHNSNNNTTPMKINTSSNIPKLAKSNDNLSSSLTATGGNNSILYSHVPSSGYGQQSNGFFNRNSRSRSSLHKNFFRSKRVEPEGTENTGTTSSSSGNGMSSSPSPLIITPMTYFTKNNKTNQQPHELYRPKGSTLLSQDPSYDPYAMAAKQLEELLKTQPIPTKSSNKKTARKLGLEKAFESVGVHSDSFTNPTSFNNSQDENDVQPKRNEDPFVFDVSSGKMDDSYWDEILQKGSKTNQDENQVLMSTPEAKAADANMNDINKSRTFSQISSADSGFSRSDVHDRDFEALESMVATDTQNKDQGRRNHSAFPSLSKSYTFNTLNRNYSLSEEPESPMQISPSPTTPSFHRDSYSSSSTSPTGARFCHECGNAYPSAVAKFCPECGEKRVFKF